MEKSHYDKELNRLTIEANNLEQRAKLDFDTASFLDNEAKKLEEIIDNVNSTEEQRESALIKLEALYNRIKCELSHVSDDEPEAKRIKRELIALNTAALKEGLI